MHEIYSFTLQFIIRIMIIDMHIQFVIDGHRESVNYIDMYNTKSAKFSQFHINYTQSNTCRASLNKDKQS